MGKQYIPYRWSENGGRTWRNGGAALTTSPVGFHLLKQPRWMDNVAGILYERTEIDDD